MNKRIAPLVMTAGLLAGTSACSEEVFEQPATITAYTQAVDYDVVTDQWNPYREDDRPDEGPRVRNLGSDRVFDYCEEVDNGFFGGTVNSECWEYEFIGGSEDTHYEARYKTVYDFMRLEEGIVRPCPAPIRRYEYKVTKPTFNLECIRELQPGQRLNKVARFILWVKSKNPKYEEQKDSGGQPLIEQAVDISASEWEALSQQQKDVTVKIQGGRIIDVNLNPNK